METNENMDGALHMDSHVESWKITVAWGNKEATLQQVKVEAEAEAWPPPKPGRHVIVTGFAHELQHLRSPGLLTHRPGGIR